MISFIIPRRSNEEYTRMVTIWYWCEETFGKMDYSANGWYAGFAMYDYEYALKHPGYGDDDLVEFSFPNEAEALLFKLKWL